jgi:hypothetical protein
MAKAEECRAFARGCMAWADRALTIEHREILLDLAMTWAEAAARLDQRHALIDQFNELTITAKEACRRLGK